MILRGGPAGCLFQNTSSQSIADFNNDKTVDFLGDVRLYNTAASPALKIRGVAAYSQPEIAFGTPSSGQIGKDASKIIGYGLNDAYSRNQLCFCVRGDTVNADATTSHCSMLVDGYGKVGINLTAGVEPGEALDIRDGSITISDTGYGNVNGIKWTSNSNGRYEIGAIRCDEQNSVNADMLFFCRAHDGNRSNPAPEVMRIKHTGRVGIATSNPSYQLHVNGSFACSGSKSFDIPHPDPSKTNWRLRHGCIESDSQGSTLYKRKLECVKGENVLELPSYVEHLCEDIMCFCSPVKHFGNAYASVLGSTLHVTTSKAGFYNILIMADRKDPCAKECFSGCEYEEVVEEVEAEVEEEEEPLATTTTDEEEPL
jgi:hypothetical protein